MCRVLNENALTALCRLLEKSIIYFAESKHKLELSEPRFIVQLEPASGMRGWLQSQAIHPFALTLTGPKSFTTCQSDKKLNMMKEINTNTLLFLKKKITGFQWNPEGKVIKK